MKRISEIENLVDEMADSYDYPEEKLVSKMNQLIGQDWDAQTYWEYTCEYWSHHSLEETVYALLHNGEYPATEKSEYYVWNTQYSLEELMSEIVKQNEQANLLEETHLFFRLGKYTKNRELFGKFNTLPMDEIYQWFQQTFSDWEQKQLAQEDDRSSLRLSFPVEYGIERNILLYPYEEKCFGIFFTNVDKKDVEMVLAYLKPLVTDFYPGN